MEAVSLLQLGLAMVLIGFLLVFIAFVLLFASQGSGRTRGAAVLFIGPIPVAVGTDKNTLLIAVILALAMVLLAYLMLAGHWW